jgi:hypothetical protein
MKWLNTVIIIITAIVFYFIFRYLFTVYEGYTSDPILLELHKQLAILDNKFKDVDIYEGDKSYTINKKKVYICLKDEHGKYYSRNMLVYVILHEYAHILCDEIGHTDKFFDIFQKLLAKASASGIYNPSIPPVKNYCGHN